MKNSEDFYYIKKRQLLDEKKEILSKWIKIAEISINYLDFNPFEKILKLKNL